MNIFWRYYLYIRFVEKEAHFTCCKIQPAVSVFMGTYKTPFPMILCSLLFYFTFAERPLVANNIFNHIYQNCFFLTRRTQSFLMSNH